MLNIDLSTYNKYENNPLTISLKILIKILNVLNVNIDDFLFTLKQDILSKLEEKGE